MAQQNNNNNRITRLCVYASQRYYYSTTMGTSEDNILHAYARRERYNVGSRPFVILMHHAHINVFRRKCTSVDALSNEIIKRPRLHVQSANPSAYLVIRIEYLKTKHASRLYTMILIKVGLERANAEQMNVYLYGVLDQICLLASDIF